MSTLRKIVQRLGLRLGSNAAIIGYKMTVEEVVAFYEELERTVVTLVGYSGMEYQDVDRLLQNAKRRLAGFDPAETLINIGATQVGIGTIYRLAKSMGFMTGGIVSDTALGYSGQFSKSVDFICFVADSAWGGFLPGGKELSPTSQAMVQVSDRMIAFGGGEISRDELLGAQAMGIPIEFYPAEVNHARAIRRARARGLPPPTSFWGEAHEVFGEDHH